MKQILLSSKNKDVQEYTLVSDEDYEHLNQLKWHKTVNGYAACIIKNNSYTLHRYIMMEILGHKDLTRHNIVDHINNNKLDNQKDNLRLVTRTENARNKDKKQHSSSKYIGVHWNSVNKKWIVKVTSQNLLASYDSEEWAAYQWDIWIQKYKVMGSKVNNIECPENFVEYVKPQKHLNLPKHIFKNGKKYIFRFCGKSPHTSNPFETIDKAVCYRDEYMKTYEKVIDKPAIIIRNINNDCVLELFKNKIIVGEILVDQDIYEELSKIRWSLGQKYVSGCVNGKKTKIHRYIMNYNGDNYIDHINNNPLDNRKQNLRIVTPQQNAMNKNSLKNSTSQYLGVSMEKTKTMVKWVARIKHNGKNVRLGAFNNEIQAAKARDIATIKYYGEYGKLNFPITS